MSRGTQFVVICQSPNDHIMVINLQNRLLHSDKSKYGNICLNPLGARSADFLVVLAPGTTVLTVCPGELLTMGIHTSKVSTQINKTFKKNNIPANK